MNYLLSIKDTEPVSKVDFMTFPVQLHTMNDICSYDPMIYKWISRFSMQLKYINIDKNHNLNRMHFVLSFLRFFQLNYIQLKVFKEIRRNKSCLKCGFVDVYIFEFHEKMTWWFIRVASEFFVPKIRRF